MILEDLQPDATVRGILPDGLVRVVNVEWHGSGTAPEGAGGGDTPPTAGDLSEGGIGSSPRPAAPRRYHGSVQLDATRVGRDASRIADEVIAHLVGQVGAEVTVTLEIEARLPDGATEQLVRIVTENSRSLKFTDHGFERE